MNRRTFLIRSSVFTSASLLARPLFAQTPAAPSPAAAAKAPTPPVQPVFQPLRRGVGVFTARGGSIGWLVNKDALAVVDTQFPDTAAMCLAGLPGRDGRTLDVVVNTHHHGDHVGGNAVFKPVAKSIVAHENALKLHRGVAEKAGPNSNQAFADTTFPTTWRKELGDEVISARYHGAAHTNGDVTVFFEKANVVHLGDLGFNRIYPAIDRPAGASIRHWVVVMDEIAKTYPADAMYIFGHGSAKAGITGSRADLIVFRDYLSGLLDYTQKKIAAGEPREKIVTLENLPGFPDFHLPLPNRMQSNLGVAYDELTEKKV